MLEVIEGNEPLPRWLPPYLHGLFALAADGLGRAQCRPGGVLARTAPTRRWSTTSRRSPTSPYILARGPSGSARSAPSSRRERCAARWSATSTDAGVVEVEFGTPLGGARTSRGHAEGRAVRAVLSGVSNPVITDDQLATPVSYEGFEAIGSGLGSAGFIVYDDTTCMVEVTAMLSRFLSVESCGQCPPCKLGTAAITEALDRIVGGTGDRSRSRVISERLRIVTDGNRCYLPVEEQRLVSSLLATFPSDFADHLETGRCPGPRRCRSPRSSTSPTASSPMTPASPQAGRLDLRRRLSPAMRWRSATLCAHCSSRGTRDPPRRSAGVAPTVRDAPRHP